MGSSTTGSDTMSLHAPRHPVPQLQGPFEESMAESINEASDRARPDPIARRTMLLERPTYERVCAGRWKQKPGERYHPLWKISAQMSFGIHLLAEGLAKSEDDVMTILQTHVDDVDGFLESTTEDFDLAQSDVAERLRYLKLPLEHVEVFDRMLEDRTFRVSIVEGNEKIEHIMARTSEATKDALKDVQKGLQATDALGKYLEKVDLSWRTRSPEHDAVFVAMVGNVDGWYRAFEDLHHQGTRLGVSLVQLAGIVSEVQRRAGVASRKTLLKLTEHAFAAMRNPGSPQTPFGDRDSFVKNIPKPDVQSAQVPSKPLPKAPSVSASLSHSTQTASFQDNRPLQKGAFVSEEKSVMDRFERRGQAAQRPVLGDETKRPKSQKSAPDLKQKSEDSSIVDLSSASELGSLGFGAGLGLGRMGETNSSRPVIIQRESTEAMLGNSGIHPHSELKSPKAYSARILNAPVPHQTPTQRKRLSLSLKTKNKNKLTDGQPKHRSPKASNQLLKSAKSLRVGTSAGPAGDAANFVSPLPSASRGSPDNSYVNTPLQPSSSVISPSPSQTTPQSPTVVKPHRMYNRKNPTFTSHPPNMEMATSPPLQEVQTPEMPVATLGVPSLRTVPDLDSGHTSYESSLGEPGPEIIAANESDVAAQETPTAELDSGSPVAQGPVELEAFVPAPSQSIAFELEAPQHIGPEPLDTSAARGPLTPTVGATIQSHSDFFKLPPQQAGDRVSKGVEMEYGSTKTDPSFTSKDRSQTALLHRSFQLPASDQSRLIGLIPLNAGELNKGTHCQKLQLPLGSQSDVAGLKSVENGDSQTHVHESSSELPTDTGAEMTHLRQIRNEPRMAMQRRSFQLTPAAQDKDTTAKSPKANETRSMVDHRSSQSPSYSQQHVDEAKDDAERSDNTRDSPRDGVRPTMPSRISTSEAIVKSKRQSPKHHLNLIEIISHTPSGSPIHERPTSSASFHSAANSSRLTSYRASIDLAPREEAPAPPAPGGRGMVNPDYATAGAFEGEKRPKRASGASMTGLKKIFSGGSTNHSRAGSVRVVELPEGSMSGGGLHDNVDMMTPGGSDVLWFKGMGRDGVWISGN